MAIRVIVAGMGQRGQDWAREVQSNQRFELVGCVDNNRDVLHSPSLNVFLSPARRFAELDQALSHNNCDAVIIATSPDQHVEPTKLAISNGLAVIVEKPFTLRLQEAAGLVSLAEQHGRPLLVAQNFRYMRAFRTVKRLIGEGVIGRVGMVACHYYTPTHQMAASLAELHNSVLWGMSIHHLDALRYVLGKQVTGVMADSFTPPWGKLPPGGSFQMLLSFEDEIRASYSATYDRR